MGPVGIRFSGLGWFWMKKATGTTRWAQSHQLDEYRVK